MVSTTFNEYSTPLGGSDMGNAGVSSLFGAGDAEYFNLVQPSVAGTASLGVTLLDSASDTFSPLSNTTRDSGTTNL